MPATVRVGKQGGSLGDRASNEEKSSLEARSGCEGARLYTVEEVGAMTLQNQKKLVERRYVLARWS
jgi:hypothetical protein